MNIFYVEWKLPVFNIFYTNSSLFRLQKIQILPVISQNRCFGTPPLEFFDIFSFIVKNVHRVFDVFSIMWKMYVMLLLPESAKNDFYS